MALLKECTKVKTIPCEWRVEETLCNAPPEIDCHYAEPLEEEPAFTPKRTELKMDDVGKLWQSGEGMMKNPIKKDYK